MTQTIWHIDKEHSDVQFKIKHLVISNVTGVFKEFSGVVMTSDHDFDDAQVEFGIEVKSIDTNQPVRDEHLRSSDFFEADVYPKIEFVTTSFKRREGAIFEIIGNLTMKGITKETVFQALYGGKVTTAEGIEKAGFEITGIVDRKEFGITFNALTETGGLMLGEKIHVTANIQMNKQ